jgi:putative ABC transport system permease protein
VNDQDVHMFIPASVAAISDYVELRDRVSGEKRTLSDEGAIISEKLAKLYGLEPGDPLNVVDKDNETFKIKVIGITENYVMHYVYMTPAYYSSVFGHEPVFNTELLNYTTHDKAWEDKFGEKLTDNEGVAAVSFSSNVGTAFDDTMKSMDVVTLVLIVSAAALAFVVLYNLTNINVSERIRELSTIKVLGFYDKEVTLYIYRENMLLSLLGIVAGSGLGIILHSFVLNTAELDATMFAPIIKWPSYVYAALLTLLFSGIVMAFMHIKLKRIHMIEALKSVE